MTAAEKRKHEAVKKTNRINREYIKYLKKRIDQDEETITRKHEELKAMREEMIKWHDLATFFRDEALKAQEIARDAQGLLAEKVHAPRALFDTERGRHPRRLWQTRRRRP